MAVPRLEHLGNVGLMSAATGWFVSLGRQEMHDVAV